MVRHYSKNPIDKLPNQIEGGLFMVGSKFSFFSLEQINSLRDRVFDLLENHGVKLDPHPEMLRILANAGVKVDNETGIIKIPQPVMENFINQAPKNFSLGARCQDRVLKLPRPDRTFYVRTGTGSHGWIDPETNKYRKVMTVDLANWAKLINGLDEISFMPFLFPNDVPRVTADIYGLSTLLKNTDKHILVQPYSTESIEYLINIGKTVAGGNKALKGNPLISMITCALTPRAFKQMDIEIILQSSRAGLPIHACSLPSAGSTAPITPAAVILLATAEILTILAMAQAVAPGTPVVACPIIFSVDMRTGRSLQSSVESLKCASGAVQFIKAAYNLPTHNYGSGSDAPNVDGQSMSERSMLSMLMGVSGSDIFGGAGQLEVATAVSPLQLIVDNEVVSMVRHIMQGINFDDDNLAWNIITETNPGDHFLASQHTLQHCRDGFTPHNFTKLTRDTWENGGGKDLMDNVLEQYHELMKGENRSLLSRDLATEIDSIVKAANKKLVHQ